VNKVHSGFPHVINSKVWPGGPSHASPELPLPAILLVAIIATRKVDAQQVDRRWYAPILLATPNQINAFVPNVVQPGATTTVQVEVDGILSAPVIFSVAKAAFGLFTANSSGSGQGAILNKDGSYNGPSNLSERGSIVSPYGTGEGSSTPLYPAADLVLSTPYSMPDNP
jgi:uncharacterized protein (TIGR03437 family)